MAGSVEDDGFTGYFANKWTDPYGLSFTPNPREPETAAIFAITRPYSEGRFTSPVIVIATLTADDGILVVSDDVMLTYVPPSS